MPNDPTTVYLESEAASIPRLKLVRLVYAGAIDSLKSALVKLQARDRAGFVRAVNKAQDLIAELHLSIDHENGGDVARDLERLYEWTQRTLTPSCLKGDPQGIEHAIQVLTKLQEAWDSIRDENVEAPLPTPE
jgi:flagellar protein FliS